MVTSMELMYLDCEMIYWTSFWPKQSIFTEDCCIVTSLKGKFAFVKVTVYPKNYARGFCFAVLCCGYTLTDFPISIRLTSLALWQSNDCPGASKATLMNMDKYFMWIHYERLHNHNKAKHNKTVCIFLGIYCTDDHIKQDLVLAANNLHIDSFCKNVKIYTCLSYCLRT